MGAAFPGSGLPASKDTLAFFNLLNGEENEH